MPCNGKWVPDGDTASSTYSPEQCAGYERLRVRTGVSVNGGPRPGWVLVRVDLDKHYDFQDPATRLAELRAALSTADNARLVALPSTNGAGLDVLFLSPIAYASQPIYDPHGRVAGELICVGGVQLAPAPPDGVTIPALGKEARDRLLGALHFAPNAGPSLTPGNSDRNKDIREGLALAAGWKRETVPDWRVFLQQLDPRCSAQQHAAAADLLREYTTTGDRSRWFADFVQHAMLRAYELGTGYAERCRRVFALAYRTKAAGKGTDSELVKDAAALIARIVRGARKANGGVFVQPYWCKARPAGSDTAPSVAPSATTKAPSRPAHRPVGSRTRGIAKLARELARRAEDAPGRLFYYAHDLAEAIGVAERTLQAYMAQLVKDALITRGQEAGRGGRGWLELNPAFWGADKYLKTRSAAAKAPAQSAAPGVHTESRSDAPPRGETASDLQCNRSIRIQCAPPVPAEGSTSDDAAVQATQPGPSGDAGAQRPAGARASSDAPSPTIAAPAPVDALAIDDDEHAPAPTDADAWARRVRKRAEYAPGGESWGERWAKRERSFATPRPPASAVLEQPRLYLPESDDLALLAVLEGRTPSYSVDGVLLADGRIAWRVWDDNADRVLEVFGTEQRAEAHARALLRAADVRHGVQRQEVQHAA